MNDLVLSECAQLYDIGMSDPQDTIGITHEMKKEALYIITMVKDYM